MPNRLARESSPYLLQHANNPVDWHAWGDEAFARARAEDKPIFLSIGYSTCHWCHVMEHESFEDEGVAAVINDHFIPIKVDREERPDVDRVYMMFVQATTGSGGWPMSVWLTPDLKPFYGGTYFPPTSRYGRPGFVDVLSELARLWREERPRLVGSADGVIERLRAMTGNEPTDGGEPVATPDAIQVGVRQFRQAFDRRHAGFGGAPKFPRPSELLFLLRAWTLADDDTVRGMVLDTLRAMAFGGMYDHIGGGFHRYSVDAGWRVPHFEKMLYDQAQLVLALLEGAQASGESFFGWVAGETIGYVARDLMHPDGGFYSAEDADSIPPEHASDPNPHKMEGAFYLWSAIEVERLLGADAEVVGRWYGIESNGNVAHDPQGEFGTKNILYIAQSAEDIARRSGMSEDDVMARIVRARGALFEARLGRPRPHLDDKVITAWNGLMIAGCARAARVFDGETTLEGDDARTYYLGLATRAAAFVRERLWDEGRGVLLRRERAGQAGIDGFAEDYAYFIWGLLELFQATGDVAWLTWARRLQQTQDRLFWDARHGGWFSTSGQDATVLLRMKEDYDGAEPSASSVAAQNALVLSHLTGDEALHHQVEQTLGRIGARAGEMARQVPFMLCTLAWWHAGVQQVVIVGAADAEDTRDLRRVVASAYLPFAVHVLVEPGDAHARLAEVLPWVRDMTMRDGRATAYVCRNFACELPVTDPEALAARLRMMSDTLPS